jgi:hypothetical protein
MTPCYECIKISYELNQKRFDSEKAFWKLNAQLKSDPFTSNVVMAKNEICLFAFFTFNMDILKIDQNKMNLLLSEYLTSKYSLKFIALKTTNRKKNLAQIRNHPYMATIIPKRFLCFNSWEYTMSWKRNSFGKMKIQKMDYVKYKELYQF